MYSQVETDKVCYFEDGSTFIPVATLVNNYGGGHCQIYIQDSCYCIAYETFWNSNKTLYRSTGIFITSELLKILNSLPSLK